MRYKDFKTTLSEVSMMPAFISKSIQKIDARVGMEFELVIPATFMPGYHPESLPDYSNDTTVGDIQSIIFFFGKNDANSEDTLNKLAGILQKEYSLFIDEEWQDQGLYYLREWLETHNLKQYRDTVLAKQNLTIQQARQLDDNQLRNLKQQVLKVLNDHADQIWQDQDAYFYEAKDDWLKTDKPMEEDYLLTNNLKTMKNVWSMYQSILKWPYVKKTTERDVVDIKFIAQEFKSIIKRPVNWSYDYHGAKRMPDTYSIEPDTSVLAGYNVSGDIVPNTSKITNIKGVEVSDDLISASVTGSGFPHDATIVAVSNNSIQIDKSFGPNVSGKVNFFIENLLSADAGVEIISPPLEIEEIKKDLNTVVRWAKSKDAYTNETTGLHMNVSIPNYSKDNIDFVKLVLFLGDEYILNAFGRSSNEHTVSALKKLKMKVKYNDKKVSSILDLMKSQLHGIAQEIFKTHLFDKKISVNIKDKYVEFRSPGGDWLNTDINFLISTLERFIYALDIACNPNKHKQEYAKKLYKLLTQTEDNEYAKILSSKIAGK